jgi:hypothetical protein
MMILNRRFIMKKIIILLLSLSSIFQYLYAEEILTRENGIKIIIYDDHTWAEHNSSSLSIQEIVGKNKSYLRQGIQASEKEIEIACEMYEQGWRYTMPRPKSSKAAWGVSDGRTTWYKGWWHNTEKNQYSATTPKKSSSGLYIGDNQNSSNTWRNGGSPRRPDIYMFLLSENGGPRF